MDNILREEIFAGINFREVGFTKDFAGINFPKRNLYKDFAGVNFAFDVEDIFHDFSLWFWE